MSRNSPRNSLNGQNRFRLAKWIDASWDWIVAQRPSYVEAAKKATAELGVRISAANLSNTLSMLGNKTWPTARPRDNNADPDALKTLATAVLLLLDDLRPEGAALLRDQIADIAGRGGHELVQATQGGNGVGNGAGNATASTGGTGRH